MWPLFPMMLFRGTASPFLRKPLTSESFTTKAQRSRHASQTFMVARLGSRQQAVLQRKEKSGQEAEQLEGGSVTAVQKKKFHIPCGANQQ